MKKLIVLVGPTGVGKTKLSLQIATHYHCPILSVDSRQLYRGMEIGTAAPTKEQQAQVEHLFVGMLNVEDYYSVSQYEEDAIATLDKLFETHDTIVATGGSMMYVDALCYGVDPIPTIDPKLRDKLYRQYEAEGLESILAQLKLLDPTHYNEVDQKNYKRVIHALEVCLMTSKPYSSLRTLTKKTRPFQIARIGIERNREELYDRINLRVDNMISDGLLDEAKHFYPQKHLNALNTVGYKELFKHLDREWTLDHAIEKIKQSTRIYSRQQLRWFKKDEETYWFNLSQRNEEEVFKALITIVNE